MKLSKKVIYLDINTKDINFYDFNSQLNNYRYSSQAYTLISEYIKSLGYKIFTATEESAILNVNYQDIQEIVNNRDLISGDRVSFLPGVDVPRYKFKEKGDEVGFVTKRNIETSNVLVVGKKAIEKTFIGSWRYSLYEILYKDLENILNICDIGDQLDNLFTEELGTIEPDTKLILSRNVNQFLHTLHIPNNSVSNYGNTSYPLYCDFRCLESQKELYDEDIYNKLKYAISNNLDIMTSEFVNEFITGSVEVDDKMYKRLDQMLSSNDVTNIELAMETMTNLDYSNSLFTMIVLLNRHRDTMIYRKAYNSVSFKGFRQRLNNSLTNESYRIEPDYVFKYYLNYVDCIRMLGRLKVLTKRNILALKNSIQDDMKRFNGSTFFVVDKVKYTDALENLLKISQENIEELGENFKDLNNYELIEKNIII